MSLRQTTDVKNINLQIKKNIKNVFFNFIKTLKNMDKTLNYTIHQRLNGTSSPVLTATMSFLWESLWLSDFFRPRHGDHIPEPIFTQNGSNDVDSRKMCLFTKSK